MIAQCVETPPLIIAQSRISRFERSQTARFLPAARGRRRDVVEVCAAVAFVVSAASDGLADAVFESLYGADAEDFKKICSVKKNAEAISHLFAVASGLKSQMTGETEILGQVKAAYERARGLRHCGPTLNALFQKAIHCAKWVRTNTEIGRGKISLGSVSSELAARIFEDISRAKILLLGSGEAGRLIADALYVRGARDIVVASRTRANAETLAEKVCGRAENLSEAIQKLSAYDIILSASFSDEPLIVYNAVNEAMQKRRNRPMFLIDLAIPRNIEEKCAQIEDVYIYNLSDLSKIANENMEARRAEIESVPCRADTPFAVVRTVMLRHNRCSKGRRDQEERHQCEKHL